MTKILGLSGSLRRGSLNTRLLHEAASLLPAGTQFVLADIRDVPLYDGDVEEEQGIPAAVTRIKEQLAQSDGLLLVSPEYNSSLPGVLKNAIDWMSRPSQDIERVFGRKAVALLGASPGRLGTARAQIAWLPTLRALQMRYFSELPPFYLSAAHKAFDAQGQLADAGLREQLGKLMREFAVFAART